jgi:uncharacterized protein
MSEAKAAPREQLIDGLLKNNNEFRRLHKNHQYLEMQLEEMNRRRYLKPEEELERKNIQKKKLQEKDRMEELLRRATQNGSLFA